MANKNFFDLLRDKMADLRPGEKHLTADWEALGDRLDAALPYQPDKRRRGIVLPLLLLSALLSSNAVWWRYNNDNQLKFSRLEAKLDNLQASVAPTSTIRTDTIWKTIYVQMKEPQHLTSDRLMEEEVRSIKVPLDREATISFGTNVINKVRLLPNATALNTASNFKSTTPLPYDPGIFSAFKISCLPPLGARNLALVKYSESEMLIRKPLLFNLLNNNKPTETVSKKRIAALRPKFFKVGITTGWLYAASRGLMHEGGFSYGLHGEIGFTRHWSITGEVGMGQIHYKAHDMVSILGSPVLPIASYGHHFSEADVTGQKMRQFDLGLRYTFAQPGQPRPFLGLKWGGQTLLPFRIEYETLHEATGSIIKGVYDVTYKTHLRNMIGCNAGLDIPLSRHFDLTLEGFYQTQWKKWNRTLPDLMGVRGGLNWIF